MHPGYDTKLHPVVSLQFWSSASVMYLFIPITPRSTQTRNGSKLESNIWVQ